MTVLESFESVADVTISQVYYDKQYPVLDYLPNKIATKRDIFNVRAETRDRIKQAGSFYKKIKNRFLLKLDDMAKEAALNLRKDIINFFSDESYTREVEQKIKELKTTKENVKQIVILYDELSWFKDPNLISTIRFHEKLHEIFMTKAEASLNVKLNSDQIKSMVDKFSVDEKYIKAVIVVTFYPLLAYGAIYASIQNDYNYIQKYLTAVSEAAEEIFNKSSSTRDLFFQQTLA